MALEFRDLRADEIDCRIAQVKESGISLLLYKDARCDMNILDETVGAMNWKKSYELIDGQLFCTVSIYDTDRNEWVGKQDVGVESNTEEEKGRASDAQKRSCFVWGIGRELYTAPFIWVGADKCNMKEKNGKYTTYDKFAVQEITIKEKKIIGLTIYNTSKGCVAFTMGKVSKATTTTAAPKATATKTAKKEQPKAQPAAQAPEKPVEVISFRDEFRKFVKENNLDNDTITSIINDCNLKNDSPDEEWEKGLMYGIAYIGGIVQ